MRRFFAAGGPEGVDVSPSDVVRLRLTLLDPEVGIRAFGVLSDAELNRARRFLDPEFGEMFMARRALVRYVVGDWLGLAPEELEFGQGAQGKPYVKGYPGTHFSVSHAGRYTLIGVGSQQIGVDIETLEAIVDVEGIAGRVLTVKEGDALAKLGRQQQPAALLSAWARKEAAAKADGAGLAIDLATIETAPTEAARGLQVTAGKSKLHVWDVQAPPGHAAALASGTPRCHLDFAFVETPDIEGARLSPAG